MSEPNVDEVLSYLSIWKTRAQVCEKFDMSNSESYHFLRWLEKGNYIIKTKLKIEKHTNKCWFYKVK